MLPGRVRYSHLFGGAVLAGIGFTISLFITDLAFHDPVMRDQAKIGILSGSLIAALLGAWILRVMGERTSLCSPAGDSAPASLPAAAMVGAGPARRAQLTARSRAAATAGRSGPRRPARR